MAECAGGPRAFKYGTTRRYVLGLEAVLPTGEIIRTGGKTVKNVVGYDLTQLLVGSEGTLAIITEITLRLVPRPAARRVLRAWFADVGDPRWPRSAACSPSGVVPAALELVDAVCLAAVRARGGAGIAPDDAGAALIVEVDGTPQAVDEELRCAAGACEAAAAGGVVVARDDAERTALWQARRDLSLALRAAAPRKINHDVVVPQARIPDLFDAVEGLRRDLQLDIACFGHVGDGNIHVNLLVDPDDQGANGARAGRRAAAVRGGRGAGGFDQRRARHRLHQAAVPAPGAVGRDDRTHAAPEAGVRPARHPQPGQDFPGAYRLAIGDQHCLDQHAVGVRTPPGPAG